MGKRGIRSSGPIGLPVPGCNGGCGGFGISGIILYHCLGISDWFKLYIDCFTVFPPCKRKVNKIPRRYNTNYNCSFLLLIRDIVPDIPLSLMASEIFFAVPPVEIISTPCSYKSLASSTIG